MIEFIIHALGLALCVLLGVYLADDNKKSLLNRAVLLIFGDQIREVAKTPAGSCSRTCFKTTTELVDYNITPFPDVNWLLLALLASDNL